MICGSPCPVFGTGLIVTPIWSRQGQGMVRVSRKFDTLISDINSISYKKAVRVVRVVKATFHLLHMCAHVFFFLFLDLVFIEKSIDHLDQASNSNGLYPDHTP